MKVLVNRVWGYISSHLLPLSVQYSWSVRTEYGILEQIFKYCRISVKPGRIKRWNRKFDSQILKQLPIDYTHTLIHLPPEKLRKVIRLCEIIRRFPDMFNRLFSCFTSVPLVRLDTILILDKQWGCP